MAPMGHQPFVATAPQGERRRKVLRHSALTPYWLFGIELFVVEHAGHIYRQVDYLAFNRDIAWPQHISGVEMILGVC